MQDGADRALEDALQYDASEHLQGLLLLSMFLPANLHIFWVEPRGIEPLTSAVQKLTGIF